jgi:hypothetical protein
MGYERIKPEHAGAKNGGGAWMTRAEAKQTAKRRRRRVDKWLADESLNGVPMQKSGVGREP